MERDPTPVPPPAEAIAAIRDLTLPNLDDLEPEELPLPPGPRTTNVNKHGITISGSQGVLWDYAPTGNAPLDENEVRHAAREWGLPEQRMIGLLHHWRRMPQ